MTSAEQFPEKQALAQNMLAKLKASFREQLLDKMLLIENASVRLSTADEDEVAMACIKRECHKLSGVSKTLGFDRLGELATEIDCAIKTDDSSWQEIQPIVEQLLDCMETELD